MCKFSKIGCVIMWWVLYPVPGPAIDSTQRRNSDLFSHILSYSLACFKGSQEPARRTKWFS